MGAVCANQYPDGYYEYADSPSDCQWVENQIQSSLSKGKGLPFFEHDYQMNPAAVRTCADIAQTLMQRPRVAVKIICCVNEYPAWFSSFWAKRLSVQRAEAVKQVLRDAGVQNIIVPEGWGYNDNAGARIQFIACSKKQLGLVDRTCCAGPCG
mmetsp:Transcript_15690/g.33384  ORF Transcript_15690/g.33384 Transcript_15690/m.33384 type:complete len:153 (-) Transcript_15690:86-544(-)